MILIIILSQDFISFFVLFFLILTLLHQPAYVKPFFISVSFQDYPCLRYQLLIWINFTQAAQLEFFRIAQDFYFKELLFSGLCHLNHLFGQPEKVLVF